MRRSSILLPALVAALTTLAGAVVPANSQGRSTMARFLEIGEYELVSGGKTIPARVFTTMPAGIVLVDAPTIAEVIELLPRGFSQTHFLRSDYTELPDGTRVRPAQATPSLTGKFTVVAGQPLFSVDGREYSLRERPHVLGAVTRAELLRHDPTYEVRSRLYTPTPQLVESLKNVTEPVRLQVFLGTWCKNCREMVPNILKLEDSLKGAKVKFEYYGLPKDMNDPLARRLNVGAVPTGVLWLGDKEIGRAEAFSWRTADATLLRLLLSAGLVPQPGSGASGSALR